LGVGERCIEADGQGIKYSFCRLGTADGPWQYDEVSLLYFLTIEISQTYKQKFYTNVINVICAFAENKDSVT